MLLPVLLWVIYTVTFLLAWRLPGNPLEAEGRRPDKAVVEALLGQYNLQSDWGFYWEYLYQASGAAWIAGDSTRLFNFGPSLKYADWSVNDILASSLPVSIQLGAGALLVALVLGVGAGVCGALWRGRAVDHATLVVALTGISLPTFVTGSVLLICFSMLVPLLPPGGWGQVRQMVLPTLTLSLPFAAYIARLTRLGMIDVLSSDFVRTARAKGLSRRAVVFDHALKVAFLPVLSFLGPAAAGAMTGSFVVEKVFSVPGIGQHFVDAVLNKDLFIIIAVALVYSTLLILFNLAVDVAYHWLDPRIEASS
jgi:oligopeptide transport system permease protein